MLKSFKVGFSKIKSIKSVGKEKTYDIEMKNEPHNFVANDFISHNSHAVAYTYLSFQMAFLKCYYRKYFNLAVMNLKGNEELIQAAADDCFVHHIEIKPFNINETSFEFAIDDKDGGIIPGAMILKGVGRNSLKGVIANKPYANFEDFINRSKDEDNRRVRSNVLLALYERGFFETAWGKTENQKVKEFLDNRNKPKEPKKRKSKSKDVH